MPTQYHSYIFYILLLSTVILTSCVTLQPKEPLKLLAQQTTELHELVCNKKIEPSSPWSIHNLYHCGSRSFFIPYQLWSGAQFLGSKNTVCMHPTNHTFVNIDKTKTNILGPTSWENPVTDGTEVIWVRENKDKAIMQYFTCHENGIDMVFDTESKRSFKPGRCMFPGGAGWQLGRERPCRSTSIEIRSMTLDAQASLESIVFKWRAVKSSLVNEAEDKQFDYIYRYERGKGMTDVWKQ